MSRWPTMQLKEMWEGHVDITLVTATACTNQAARREEKKSTPEFIPFISRLSVPKVKCRPWHVFSHLSATDINSQLHLCFNSAKRQVLPTERTAILWRLLSLYVTGRPNPMQFSRPNSCPNRVRAARREDSSGQGNVVCLPWGSSSAGTLGRIGPSKGWKNLETHSKRMGGGEVGSQEGRGEKGETYRFFFLMSTNCSNEHLMSFELLSTSTASKAVFLKRQTGVKMITKTKRLLITQAQFFPISVEYNTHI